MEEKSLESIIIGMVIQSTELADFVDQKFNQLYRAKIVEQTLTRKQLADKFQVSPQSIARLNKEELMGLGFNIVKVGTLVRYEKIQNIEFSREYFKKKEIRNSQEQGNHK